MVPDIIRSITKNKTLKVRNPNYVRPWQHVFDCLNGYIFLMTKLSKNPKKYLGSYNFGPKYKKTVKVGEVVKHFSKNFKLSYRFDKSKKNKLKETRFLKLNTNKAKTKLGFDPLLDFKNSVKITINWYKSFFNKKNMQETSNKQIIEYFNKL